MFTIKDNVERITKINNLIKNVNKVMLDENKSNSNEISDLNNKKNNKLREIENTKKQQLSNALSNLNQKIEHDKSNVKSIDELHSKLLSIDKKYSKIYKKVEFINISDENKKVILLNFYVGENKDRIDIDLLTSKYNTIIYPILNKPTKKIFVSSSRKKDLELLAKYHLLTSECLEFNKKKYNDDYKLEENRILSNYSEQISIINDNYNNSISTSSSNHDSNINYISEESIKIFNEIINDDFNTRYNQIYNEFEIVKNNIIDDFGSNDIYIGDILWLIDDNQYKSKIVQEILKKNGKVFENGIGFFPVTINIKNSASFFLSCINTGDYGKCVSHINEFMFLFLQQLPVNAIEYTILDPLKKGNSIYPFLNYVNMFPNMFSKKIYTDSEGILNKIKELNQYIDTIIQQKLSNKFEDIYEYNKVTKDNPIPLKFVAIFDFPKYFEQSTIDLLISIINNSHRCGVYIFMVYNPNEITDTYFKEYISKSLNSIKKDCICFTQIGDYLKFDNYNLIFSPVELPSQNGIDSYALMYEDQLKKKMNKGILFESLITADDMYSRQSMESLVIPVGKGDGSVVQNIEFGKGSSHHAIIIGATGSGKSTLLHTIIMSSIINYSPDELNLYLMDFKSGTEFKIYEKYKLPHIKLLALDALQEFGESILVELINEQIRRSQLFKENGECTNIKAYVNKTGNKLPRILVIIDEFQILFNENTNRKVAQNCANLVNKIVTEGRAFGIHLIMSTQTLRSIRENTALNFSTIEQMRIRIGLKCGEEDASYFFGDRNSTDALVKMKGAIGTAVYNPEFTESGNFGFRVAYCSEAMQNKLLSVISQVSTDYKYDMRVFEGKRVPIFDMGMYSKEIDDNQICLKLGEPIKIAETVSIVLSKKKNNNLLIVGNNENLESKLLSKILLDIIYSNSIPIYIDGNCLIDESIDSRIKNIIEKFNDVKEVNNRKDLLIIIEKLYYEYKFRKKGTSTSNTKFVVIINKLQLVDILIQILSGSYIDRSDYIDEESENPIDTDYSSAIKELIEQGYTYNIYFVILSNEYNVVRETLHYSSGLLNKLTNRIIFGISNKEADELIDGISVSNLNEITAVFSDGIKNVLQFKPFDYISEEQQNKIKEGHKNDNN